MDPKINKPCPADWNDMTGGQQSRHCDKCNKSVHNISELSADEAEQVLCHSSNSVCIRIQQAANGAFKTQSGWMKRVAIAGAATLTLIPMTGCESQSHLTGKASVPYSQPNNQTTTGTPAQPENIVGETVAPEAQPEQAEPTMGKVAAPEVMGDIAPSIGNEVVPSKSSETGEESGRTSKTKSK
ncbi:MAG: hypothetical protein ACKVQS_10105 [Fimbriimonadaceae bacterium]